MSWNLLSVFPNIYKRAKVWEFEYDKLLFFGSGNASARLRFIHVYKWDAEEDTDLLETFSKSLNLELEFVKNDQLIIDGKTEIINMLTENVC